MSKCIKLTPLLFSVMLFAACSKSESEVFNWSNYIQILWPMLVLALLCAVGATPWGDSSKNKAVQAAAGFLSRLAQVGGIVLGVAGFWRWDLSWGNTLLILMVFLGLANSTANSDGKGLNAYVKLLFSLLAIAACVFAYIRLW